MNEAPRYTPQTEIEKQIHPTILQMVKPEVSDDLELYKAQEKLTAGEMHAVLMPLIETVLLGLHPDGSPTSPEDISAVIAGLSGGSKAIRSTWMDGDGDKQFNTHKNGARTFFG